jgi:hypothetical protein
VGAPEGGHLRGTLAKHLVHEINDQTTIGCHQGHLQSAHLFAQRLSQFTLHHASDRLPRCACVSEGSV